MRTLYISTLIFLISCGGTEDENIVLDTEVEQVEKQVEELDTTIENTVNLKEPGIYQEYHPNGQLKIEGLNNMYGNREGIWISFYEDGTKWSETFYSDGIKSGHSVTFFPNGSVRYVGEYQNDERIGTWKFYDDQGNLSNEENFSK